MCYSEFKPASVAAIVKKCTDIRGELIAAGVDNLHVYFSFGNSKLGVLVPSVSLIPVADCTNCKQCAAGCYDVRHDIIRKPAAIQRANNSAIYNQDRPRYWREIFDACYYFRAIRINVGGDIQPADFPYIWNIASKHPYTKILVFTKTHNDINTYIDEFGKPENLVLIFSAWYGVNFDNRHNLPVAYPVFPDRYAARDPKYKVPETAKSCGGNCSACLLNSCGCFGLKPGEAVKFIAH